VTHISAASPAERCGLRVQEDFVVGLNGKKIAEMEADSIMGVIKKSEKRPVLLTVFNTKTQSMREVTLTPTHDWPGEGLLGMV